MNLLTTLLAGLALAAPAAALAADYLPNLFDVTVVETWDTLNVREAPDGKAKIVGTLPSTAKGVELLDRDGSGKWGRVNVGESTGWVALRFLKPQPSAWKPNALPLTLQCSGTEPFWSFKTVEKGLVFSEPDQPERPLSLRKVMDRGIEGEPMRGMIAGDDKGRLTAVMQPRQCSDGMSDRGYALAVTVILDGQEQPSRMLTGCCSIAP
ncbi:COG3650 family protein [Paracoccus sp. DMF]|uniref:COG3650 family protein n=1 Tax=Paracoccus sp. DMF TaxID=400837 RepID=UPI001103904E|nr:SH3 domain-containing protein [Paracoccus sp. DMF]MCV2448684.1 SH3 domain-containing protein [Paracoccus sp. DMF]